MSSARHFKNNLDEKEGKTQDIDVDELLTTILKHPSDSRNPEYVLLSNSFVFISSFSSLLTLIPSTSTTIYTGLAFIFEFIEAHYNFT